MNVDLWRRVLIIALNHRMVQMKNCEISLLRSRCEELILDAMKRNPDSVMPMIDKYCSILRST